MNAAASGGILAAEIAAARQGRALTTHVPPKRSK
jgi:hypothetical protein